VNFFADSRADLADEPAIAEPFRSEATDPFNGVPVHLMCLSERIRQLPAVEPNPVWLCHSKARLMAHFDRLRGGPS
jgi:hypothetical protein